MQQGDTHVNLRRLSIVSSMALSAVLGLAPVVGAQVPATAGSEPVEVPLYEVRSVVPQGWNDLGGGSYARGAPPDDLAVIVVQSAPVDIDTLWSGLLPTLARTEMPEQTGTYSSDVLDWRLWAFPVSFPGIDFQVEVAMAELDGRTYLLIVQGAADEFAALREQVLVPALEATAPLAPEPALDPATLPYDAEEVRFPGGGEDVELAGTLTLPDAPGPHPVLITMSGSGPSDRDSSLRPLTTLRPFAEIADALTRAGVAVLRYDDRGVGESTGDYSSATVQELAADGAAAIDYLLTRDDIDPERLGVLGYSEGGLYAAMLGATDPRIDYIVAMAPGVIDGVELLVGQNEALQRAAGTEEELIDLVVAFSAEVMPLARDGEAEAVGERTRELYRQLWDTLTPEEQAAAGEREAFADSRSRREIEQYNSDWFRSLLAYDARQDWASVTVPVLGLFGGKDRQVLLEDNEPALREALASAGNEDVETVIFPDANHLFQAAETGSLQEYQSLEPALIDGFLDALVEWVAEQTRVAAAG
jgi:pimeloyl-ACP methyl ester carboxylesterase